MINSNQNLIYHLHNALAEFQKESNDFLKEIKSFHDYMLQRYQFGDIDFEDIQAINIEFENFKQKTRSQNKKFRDVLDSYIKRRGYNSLTEIDKININNDSKLYGMPQSALADKYYTYQKVIHRVLKEIEDASKLYRKNYPFY